MARQRSAPRRGGRGRSRLRARRANNNNGSMSSNGGQPTRGGRRRQTRGRQARGARSAPQSGSPRNDEPTWSNSGTSMPHSDNSSREGSPQSQVDPPRRRSGGSGPVSPTSSPDTICPICRNQITNLCITNCHHRFCRDCIRRWTSRNATCPTCRTNIHTIRNILPDGGTEIIQISRAELVAHKINEIHSILILLFTVMSHTLLPEVSNYLEQLNQIARELNVQTTSTRAEAAAAAAEAAASSNSRATSAGTASNTASTSTATASPETPGGAFVIGRVAGGRRGTATTFSQEANDDSDDEASTSDVENGTGRMSSGIRSRIFDYSAGIALKTIMGARNTIARSQSSAPTSSPAPTIAQSAPVPTSTTDASVQPAPQNSQSPQQPVQQQSALSAQLLAGVAAKSLPVGTSVVVPPPAAAKIVWGATAAAASVPTQSAQARSGATPAPTRPTSAPVPVANTPAPLAGGTSGGATAPPRAAAALNAGLLIRMPLTRYRYDIPSTSSDSESGYSTLPDNPFIQHTYLSAADQARRVPGSTAPLSERWSSSAGPTTRSMSARRQGQSAINSPLSRPPTAEEARRIQEQRENDIRLLTESYNKINQVYEVLMFMHLVIHRNQVVVDSPTETPDG